MTNQIKQDVVDFIYRNAEYIQTFKFFGWEPLLVFESIKYIIDNTSQVLWKRFEIVTNTTVLSDEIGEYLERDFADIFFSIDSENIFDYDRVFALIDKYHLGDKIYFNLIISPGKEEFAMSQFEKLYSHGYKNFNILPVYFTKIWWKKNLLNLSNFLKRIIELSLSDSRIKLYGFQKNNWYNYALTYSSLFLDLDFNCYYSDFISTRFGMNKREELALGKISDMDLSQDINSDKQKRLLLEVEQEIIGKMQWQKELHQIMDYFSLYLNQKSNGY